MKKLTDLMRAAGVTRKVIEGYNEKGLLNPTSNEKGHWRYRDDDIRSVCGILMFQKIGYSRKEIKEMQDKGILDWDGALARLEKERRRIDGMMRFVRMNKMITEGIPENLQEMDWDIDLWDMCREKGFSNALNEAIEEFAQYSDEDMENGIMSLACQIFMLGMLRKQRPDDEGVQRCVEHLYEYGAQVVAAELQGTEFVKTNGNGEEERCTFEQLPSDLVEEMVTELIEEAFVDSETAHELGVRVKAQDWKEMTDFIHRAIEVYQKRKPDPTDV